MIIDYLYMLSKPTKMTMKRVFYRYNPARKGMMAEEVMPTTADLRSWTLGKLRSNQIATKDVSRASGTGKTVPPECLLKLPWKVQRICWMSVTDQRLQTLPLLCVDESLFPSCQAETQKHRFLEQDPSDCYQVGKTELKTEELREVMHKKNFGTHIKGLHGEPVTIFFN